MPTSKPKKTKRRSKAALTQQASILKVAALCMVGCTLIVAGIFFYVYTQTILSFKVSPMVVGAAHLPSTYPVAITIDTAHINASIIPTTIKDGIWQIAHDKAAFLETSSTPAEGGNIIIYGHNLKNLFGNLYLAKVGDTIKVKTANNLIYEYQVKDIKTVDPSDIDEVTPTDYEVLTVYTCTGLFDSKRLVIKAYPTRVTPA